jgi:small subunit ribosomal protein S2
MPRKKKEENIEQEPSAEKMEELAKKAEENMKKIVGEANLKEAVAALTELIGDKKPAEGQKAEEQESDSEGKPRKKREKKKLSEIELKKVMTDTKETLVPLTDYIACSVHLGTKVITPDMRKFVYKRRADGLAVLNTSMIDDKIREAAKFLENFAPEDIFIACKRESGWLAVERFSYATGIRAFMKKYPAGIITNIRLENFFEPKLVIICDPWVDKNALHDANIINVPVLGICDTNNYTQGVTQVIAGNNKSRKAIGIVLFILAREYLKSLGKTDEAKKLKMEDFTGKIETAEEVEQAKAERRSRSYEAKPEEAHAAEEVKEGV